MQQLSLNNFAKQWKEESIKERWERPGAQISRVPSRMGTNLAASQEQGKYVDDAMLKGKWHSVEEEEE